MFTCNILLFFLSRDGPIAKYLLALWINVYYYSSLINKEAKSVFWGSGVLQMNVINIRENQDQNAVTQREKKVEVSIDHTSSRLHCR